MLNVFWKDFYFIVEMFIEFLFKDIIGVFNFIILKELKDLLNIS